MHYIKNLISQGEHQQLDFKFAISDAKKIARTMSAFSNTDGGKLLIGVKDNGTLYGIRNEEEYYVLESAAEMYCRPSIRLDFTKWIVDTKTIIEVSIPKGKKPPYMAPDENGKWQAYIRLNDENLKANNVMVRVWQRARNKQSSAITFTDKEKKLMSELENNKKITFLEISKLLRLTTKDTEDLLVNLVGMNIIKIHLTPDTAYYSLY